VLTLTAFQKSLTNQNLFTLSSYAFLVSYQENDWWCTFCFPKVTGEGWGTTRVPITSIEQLLLPLESGKWKLRTAKVNIIHLPQKKGLVSIYFILGIQISKEKRNLYI
jgi:hypothetical protein